MRRIRLTPAAQSDLAAIWEYSADHWGEAQAEAYVTLIRNRAQDLAEGRIVPRKADDVRPGYVVCAAGTHHLWCRMTEEAVDVIRILHQAMDVKRNL